MEQWDSKSRHERKLPSELVSNGFLASSPFVKKIPLEGNNFPMIILLSYKNYTRYARSGMKYDQLVEISF